MAGATAAPQHDQVRAAGIDCPNGYVCICPEANFGGQPWAQRADGSVKDLPSAIRDRGSSIRNISERTARVYEKRNFAGRCVSPAAAALSTTCAATTSTTGLTQDQPQRPRLTPRGRPPRAVSPSGSSGSPSSTVLPRGCDRPAGPTSARTPPLDLLPDPTTTATLRSRSTPTPMSSSAVTVGDAGAGTTPPSRRSAPAEHRCPRVLPAPRLHGPRHQRRSPEHGAPARHDPALDTGRCTVNRVPAGRRLHWSGAGPGPRPRSSLVLGVRAECHRRPRRVRCRWCRWRQTRERAQPWSLRTGSPVAAWGSARQAPSSPRPAAGALTCP